MHHRAWGRFPVAAATDGGRRHPGRRSMGWRCVGAALAASAAAVFTATPVSVAAGPVSAAPASVSTAPARAEATPVLLASGSSVYPERTTVIGASSGGYVVEGVGLNGAGQAADPPVIYAATWKAKVLSALPVPTPGTKVENPMTDVSIAGSTVSVLEASLTRGRRPTVFMENLATGAVSRPVLPPGRGWDGAAPDGYLGQTSSRDGTATTTSVLDVAQSGGGTVVLGSTTGVDPTFLAGPDDMIATAWDSSARVSTTVEYVPYSSPGTWHVLADSPGRWTCTSATGASAGCFRVAGPAEEVVDNFSLTGGALLEEVVSSPLARFRVLITPQVTSWSSCGAHGCTLTRLADSGSTTTSTAVPTGFLAAGGGEVVWGTAPTDAASSGVFSVSQTSTSPSQLVPAPLSPLAAAVVSATGGSVSWVDNGSLGLGVWRRPVSVRGGQLVVGAPSLVGSVGFGGAGAPAPAVSLASDGPVTAFSTDNPPGSAFPVGLAAVGSATGTPETVTAQADGSQSGVVGDPVSISGSWVEWQRGTACELFDLTTRRLSSLRLPGEVACLVGDGHLAWVTSSGEVDVLPLTWRGLSPLREATEVLAPRPGVRLRPGARLFLGSGDVGWDFSWTSLPGSGTPAGSESGYRVFTTSRSVPAFLVGGLRVVGLTGSDVAFEGTNGTRLTVRVITTGQTVTLASWASSVSLGGVLVAWVGPDGLPRVEALPG